MCGIAGFTRPASLGDREQAMMVLTGMCDAIVHRGPDDQGLLVADSVALGMRRLAIIDLVTGHQPLSNEDGSVVVVFNGEIYNYQALQRELEQQGHRFRTHSDTEVIVHAYEEYGERCLDRFRGMFAFALWDRSKNTLLLARDRVGKKPLYYTVTPEGSLVFGSELKALLVHPDVRREINNEALDAFLTLGYVPDPLCIFRGISKLPPGHLLNFRSGRAHLSQYWNFTYQPIIVRKEEEYFEELRGLLDESVRLRLVSDVPLGAFLSGGVDSSTIVGYMARHTGRPVKTFSIGFHEDRFNELEFARLAAQRFGTEHRELIVTPDVCQIVDDLVWHFDEPFADSSAIPTYMVSKLARSEVTVALSGDGGDELFAGYTRYTVDKQRNGYTRLPRMLRHQVMQPLCKWLPHGTWGRNHLYNISLDPLDRYVDSVSVFPSLGRAALYTDDFRHQLVSVRHIGRVLRELGESADAQDDLDRLLYIDSKTYLPGDILTKVDRMTMAVSLEARAPLLDHKLIEFVTRMPTHMRMRGADAKYVLKQAVKDLVPREILERPKQGFGVPLSMWFNAQLRERLRDTLLDRRTRQRGYLDSRYVTLLLDEHERGRRDHSGALWALLMLETWFRRFVDSQPLSPERPAAPRVLAAAESSAVFRGVES